MELLQSAISGTLESSDCQVMVQPSDTLTLEITSSVMEQYGEQIEKSIRDVLEELGVQHVNLKLNDKGALDCTIKARVVTAILRACQIDTEINWKGLMKDE